MLKSIEKCTNNVYKVLKNVPLNSFFFESLMFSKNYEKIQLENTIINSLLIMTWFENRITPADIQEMNIDNVDSMEQNAIKKECEKLNNSINLTGIQCAIDTDSAWEDYMFHLSQIVGRKTVSFNINGPYKIIPPICDYIRNKISPEHSWNEDSTDISQFEEYGLDATEYLTAVDNAINILTS